MKRRNSLQSRKQRRKAFDNTEKKSVELSTEILCGAGTIKRKGMELGGVFLVGEDPGVETIKEKPANRRQRAGSQKEGEE